MKNNMISYELAKQLKEAGFPKTESVYVVGMGMVLSAKPLFDEDGWFTYDGIGNHPIAICKFDEPYPDEHYRFAPAPTLEELIEACGDEKFSLWCYPHGYIIGFTPGSMKDDMRICKTPSEAVARLWLALNKSR